MFNKIIEFETALADYTGAPYVISTDCCTHAIELCLRYKEIRETTFTAFTYISIPMTMHKLNIQYKLIPEKWIGEYRFYGTDIWDSARRLEKNMYRKGSMQCVSFGHTKPLDAGRGGAILLDDKTTYSEISKMRYDGRDLAVSPWINQQEFKIGYHYKMNPEECVRALDKLKSLEESIPTYVEYPDCRKVKII
jgi:dTDP-4-amino-4,6-dideoxygalactose transaminase